MVFHDLPPLRQLYFVTVRDIAEGEELTYWIDDPDLMWTKKRAEKKSTAPCCQSVPIIAFFLF